MAGSSPAMTEKCVADTFRKTKAGGYGSRLKTGTAKVSLHARRVLADAGLCRQRAFAQNGQEALHGVLADHVWIGLAGLALLQCCHLPNRIVEADVVGEKDVGVLLFHYLAIFHRGV